jgi:DNA-binding beta-propeller fold protein YncE
LSPDGNRLFVTARASNAVLVFDAAKLISDPQNARLSVTPVGKSPVPIALVQNRSLAVVGISNRYGADATEPSTLSVLDTTRIGKADPIIGSVPAGAFPRELGLSPDGKVLYWTNFLSRSLQAIHVDQLPH